MAVAPRNDLTVAKPDTRPVLAAPDPLAVLRRMADDIAPGADGDTVYEAAGDLGRQCREDMDTGRWTLGDVAALLQDRYPTFKDTYGEQIVASFAREVGARKRTMFEYAETARFYPPPARAALLTTCPTLTYTHFRLAIRLTTKAERDQDLNHARATALTFLHRCAQEGWSVDQADREAKRARGDGDGPLYTGLVECAEHDGGVYFWLGAQAQLVPGVVYRVTVTEADE